MTDVIIAEAVRSAVGRAHKGSLALKRPDELAGDVMRGLLARVPQVNPEMVDDIVLGCAMPEGEQGLNVARRAGLLAGMPAETSAMTINRFCSSGLQAIAIAAGSVAFGQHDIIVAGGVESMTSVPMTGFHLSASPQLMEMMPTAHTPSQQKAKAALEQGVFKDEIVGVDAGRYNAKGERETFTFDVDELPRPETTLEGLASLRPAFALKGSVTAGSSSPLSDGAAAALVMSKAKADELGIKGLGYFRAFATAGVDPAIMGIGPVPAVQKLLAKTGLSLDDIDVIELNEAFASQSIYVRNTLGIDPAKLNVNGGAIALGHPLGCTGAKLAATALYELRRRGGRYAIVTMCIGGGQGAAGLFEAIA